MFSLILLPWQGKFDIWRGTEKIFVKTLHCKGRWLAVTTLLFSDMLLYSSSFSHVSEDGSILHETVKTWIGGIFGAYLAAEKGVWTNLWGIFTEDQVPCFKVHFRESAAAWNISSCVWYKLLKKYIKEKERGGYLYENFRPFFSLSSQKQHTCLIYI